MYFVSSPYYPEDIPVANKEFAFLLITQGELNRAVVVAFEFGVGKTIYYRTIFQKKWRTEWVSVSLA